MRIVDEKLCPLTKENCYGEKCAFWYKGSCIFGLPEYALDSLANKEISLTRTPETEIIGMLVTNKEREILEKLKDKKEEELLEEIKRFSEEELSDIGKQISIDEIIELFLQKIGLGIDRYELRRIDPQLSFKLNKVKLLLLKTEGYARYQPSMYEEIEVPLSMPQSIDKEKIENLLQQSDEELSEELINFITENFPGWKNLSLGRGISSTLTGIFWSKKGLPQVHELQLSYPEVYLKVKRIEMLAYRKLMGIIELPQVPEELKNKSEEEIINEMSKLVEEKMDELLSLNLRSVWNLSKWIEEEYCKIKGLDLSQLKEFVNLFSYEVGPETPEGKIKDVLSKISSASRTVAEEVGIKLPTIIERKRKKLLEDLTPKLIQWLKEHGISKVTRSHVRLFLSEKNVMIIGTKTDFIDMLYSSVKLKLQKTE